MKRIFLVLSVVLGLMLSSAVAHAIVYGEPDGDTHRNVGALMFDWNPDSPGVEHACTGALISPTVFLTAAHCSPLLRGGDNRVWVSFDQDVDPVSSSTTLYSGTFYGHPEYGRVQSDPHDIAVVVLDEPITGITPARLPSADLLKRMKSAGTLNGHRFTAVGYGVREAEFGGGFPAQPYDGARWRAVSEFSALNESWLRLSQNPHTGDGGTCGGDSGGPHFLGAGAQETDIVVSITVTGDLFCVARNHTYRLDSRSARAFLGTYVTLP
ncbi:Trypsin [Amycolatopsis arida]|uniref:Trypsin n=1 Tax=Amycolatopsis arida TaxID=587909 RepID=A0A1I6ACR3_9PSEU|nr:trypsin-like serine protease [Amycolatopsis arida]TDX97629.1 trypsin [Amycolatopsis arida]SFQ66413.1 Trypsin [Amycolatopsis arida]